MACGCYLFSSMSCFLDVWLAIQLSITPITAIYHQTVYKCVITNIKKWLAVIGSYIFRSPSGWNNNWICLLLSFHILKATHSYPGILPQLWLRTLDIMITWSLLPYRSIQSYLRYSVFCESCQGPHHAVCLIHGVEDWTPFRVTSAWCLSMCLWLF